MSPQKLYMFYGRQVHIYRIEGGGAQTIDHESSRFATGAKCMSVCCQHRVSPFIFYFSRLLDSSDTLMPCTNTPVRPFHSKLGWWPIGWWPEMVCFYLSIYWCTSFCYNFDIYLPYSAFAPRRPSKKYLLVLHSEVFFRIKVFIFWIFWSCKYIFL